MIRICNWYHEPKILGEKAPFEDKNETHGLCEECYDRFVTEHMVRTTLREVNNA